MPGIVVFRRRWSVGSDDLVLPAVFLFLLHTTWFVILSVVLFGLVYNPNETCSLNLVDHGRGYLGILLSCMIAEVAIIWLSMRGSILYTEPRDSMQYVLYVRLAILVIEFVYAIVGIVWLTQYYASCNDITAKSVTLGMVVCNWVVILSVCITVLCVFDPTGRTFVKLRATKRRQRNLRTYNLRHRLEEGQASSWTRRLKVFLCCTRTKDSQSDAYSEIAYLFAEFFRDLDIVPSDIIAGLVLLRQRQRAKRNAVLDEANNDILAFLSGMPVTRNTKYLDLKNAQEMQRYKEVCYYMLFALAAYGWPIYLMRKPTCGLCRLARSCSCCCLCPSRPRYAPSVTIEEDNCCGCNAIAIRRHFLDENMTSVDIVYTSCHDAVYETPFYVAVDHDKKKVVISIRGTLSPKDALTDLTGDAERLPVEGHHGTWLGHKGMVLSAEYIKKKLEQEMVLSQAFGRDLGRGTKHYGLIVVGHSLGAGTAAILSFLLRPQYPSLKCFAYSPPGGLLSEDAMEYSKEFVTAVVLGKDLVPRIGLSQLEGFRRQLLDVLQRSNKPKWRIIVGATKCIPKSELPEETEENSVTSNRLWTHPSDLTIALSASTPLYPPGRIIHVVHNHPAEQCCCCEQEDPTYFAIWGDNKAFNEVIISPAMLHEHLPYVVMEGLNKVLENYNKGKTALLSAAKVMVSPTEVDLTPELIFQSQPLPSGPSVQIGTGALTVDRRNSSTKSKSHSEISLEGFYETKPLSPVQKDPVELLLLDTKERLSVELQDRRAPLATMESLSDNESIYSFDSRRSSGFRSIRGSPSLHAVMEKDETHCFYIDPVIPEENPSLSSRTELLAADSLSKHSQETQPPDNVLNSGGTTPQRRCSEEGASSEGDRISLAPREELSLQNGRLTDVPSPQVLEFAEFIDSLFNLDSKSSSFQDIYCMMVSDSSSDFAEMPKSVSDQEILLRAQYEPNLVPKPPRLFAGSTDPSSGISVSPSFPLSSSGELMDITPTGVSSQECLATDKIRTSTPSGHVTSPAKQDDLMISAL
ncbi:diacylglycerol lipase-alpha isoform X1 [Aquila chrysaetos chrysaetos]|uniref:Diacylglycerol lipase-alpha n=2 Tax=Aquila chrysaetos chrysaetos TaxID=223781 RepID=A0A663F1P9_AQUCH|nr:diacylglycerol lipase-alpha isoform X1 [Aquila chrysaetos chrysaetos]XP_029894265.1 diacylglycerol lipase-alpha isoform X1 [Aquila chrysaetos chrysaetos]XP_029894266.1 diacylglycerol lipase-alpha isoform X1 [Aquila chrysaetos chrysaetos]XP_029894267.1 diacylglycerol lipase-alpha isoform X1 [Aquila chrysaetos chrysaetos]XP_040985048.1 diacylglycerol lipase-alpha isoform X1 [Aquila chrysaetos chrysaetos]XP_040985049.1 diacylglycerol lipase-alpha isoform X1 [Aquila chrysaetos chrysaetos]